MSTYGQYQNPTIDLVLWHQIQIAARHVHLDVSLLKVRPNQKENSEMTGRTSLVALHLLYAIHHHIFKTVYHTIGEFQLESVAGLDVHFGEV